MGNLLQKIDNELLINCIELCKKYPNIPPYIIKDIYQSGVDSLITILADVYFK